MTEVQQARVTSEWSKIAGEVVSVEKITSNYYAFGSEAACTKLALAFKHCQNVRVAFSSNLKTWYFKKPASF